MTLLPWPEIQTRFHLQDAERRQIELFQSHVPESWKELGRDTMSYSVSGEWLGVFPNADDPEPVAVFQTTPEFCPEIRREPENIPIPVTQAIFMIGGQSRSLIRIMIHQAHTYRGILKRTRVLKVCPTSKVTNITGFKYLAPVADLTFDPGRWTWRPGKGFYAYTARHGRQWRRPRMTLSLPISVKWAGLVPDTFIPNWAEVWMTGRPRNEAAFLWSFYHRAIAVNQWRQIAHSTISAMCTCCDQGQT